MRTVDRGLLANNYDKISMIQHSWHMVVNVMMESVAHGAQDLVLCASAT